MGKPLAVIILISFLFPAACIQAVEYSAKNDSFTHQAAGRKAWKTIAVLPFTGDIACRRVSGEWFTFQLDKLRLFELIGPAVSEVELRKQGLVETDTDIAVGTAREAGRMLGADAVLVGAVKVERLQGPVVGVSLIDVASGTVVATSVRSMPYLMTTSSRKRYAAATEEVARDISAVLYEVAGKPRPQPEKAPSNPDEQRMPWNP